MNRWRTGAIILVLVLLAARLLYVRSSPLALSPDEAYYWVWSQHPALSYHSKGPVVAWMMRATTTLAGNSELGVRLGAVLLATVISFLLFHLTYRIYRSDRAAFFTLALANVIPLFAAGAVIMTPDTPLVLFWILSLILFERSLFGGRLVHWVLAGVTVGLALLSKYTAGLILPCAVVSLLVFSEGRKQLRRPGPYIALLCVTAVFTPVLIWNARHGWESFTFIAKRGGLSPGSGFSLSWDRALISLGSQAGVFTPILFIALVGCALIPFLRHRRGSSSHDLLLAMFTLPPLLFFALVGAGYKVEANWPAPAYIGSLVLLAGGVDRTLDRAGLGRRRLITTVAWIAVLPALCVTFFMHDPDLLRRAGVPLREKDSTHRLRGWRELPVEVNYAREDLGAGSFLLGRTYQVSSELAFYMEEPHNTYCAPLARRINQFDYLAPLSAKRGEDAVYVEEGTTGPAAGLREAFDSVEMVSVIRRPVGNLAIYRARGFRGFWSFGGGLNDGGAKDG